MERHEIQKEYIAFVHGIPHPKKGTIDRPMGPQGGDIRVRQWVDVPEAATAITVYECTKTTAHFSVVRAFPKTGRLHQVRVHLASLGTPLLGDPLYTEEGEWYRKMLKGQLSDLERQKELGFGRVALHAASLSFKHVLHGQPLHIEAALPSDMRSFLALGYPSGHR